VSMAQIRKMYGVPAKRGMRVKAKVGPAAGHFGYIRNSKNGWLTVTDTASGRYGWWGRFHPSDIEFPTPPGPGHEQEGPHG
jgi:hypothetical protein